MSPDLTALRSIRPLYVLPSDPLIADVLIPGFRVAKKVDCMVGYFSSEVLSDLAPGLATYINETGNPISLIISPVLRPEDQVAIERGLRSKEEVVSNVLEPLFFTDDLIQQHTLNCLSWLVRVGRLVIKVALMKDAIFHPKVWLFRLGEDVMAVHGSSNVTKAGIQKNVEQVAVARSWEDPNQRYITEKLCFQFHEWWCDRDDSCTVVPIPLAIRHRLLEAYRSDTAPRELEFRLFGQRFTRASKHSDIAVVGRAEETSFSIPGHLRFTEGAFEHQGKAVDAWCTEGHRGVLEMATGSGKTITAMICAFRLYEVSKPLLIVVAAPYVPIVQQWCEEIEAFGLRPVNLSGITGASARAREINRIRRSLRAGSKDAEAIVVTHRLLCDSTFQAELKKFTCYTMIVGDEVHNLGSEGFTGSPPQFFKSRLGLSATPIRQYDEQGTEALFSYFGPVVFRYTLAEAIGRCLVEYDYHVHTVGLTREEMDIWYEITAKIRANFWRYDDGIPDEFLSKLLRDRRVVLETAQEKIGCLKQTLEKENRRTLRHTLIYASDKAPAQLEAVNRLLRGLGLLYHQLTHRETGDREKTSGIISSFQDGTLRVLTAKRVLDEGVNIPQIRKAYILASTTVERQWIQRRGRLLRKCPEIGKDSSEIHDFITVPADFGRVDDEARALIQAELIRVQEFAGLARNAGRDDGPLRTIDRLVRAAYL